MVSLGAQALVYVSMIRRLESPTRTAGAPAKTPSFLRNLKATPAKIRVVIYSRPGCHLCEEAKDAINEAQCAGKYTLDEVNIESDPALLGKYRNDIPVILIDGVEAFRHRLTAEEFRDRITDC
jgi:glutaredoxin